MDEKKLQQDAFLWFKDRYGKTPGEAGFEVMFPRERRLFFLKIAEHVVFAPDMETAKAFDKAQRYIENSITLAGLSVAFAVLVFIGMMIEMIKDGFLRDASLFSLNGIWFLVLIVLLVNARKVRILEKSYEGKIIVK